MGKKIRYNVVQESLLEGILKDDSTKGILYLISNENLAPARDTLSGLEGIEGYIGVASPTVNYYLLSKLQKRNKLEEITLVDIDRYAIKRNIQIIERYNTLGSKAYYMSLRYEYKSVNKEFDEGRNSGNDEYFRVKEKIESTISAYSSNKKTYREFIESSVSKPNLIYDVKVNLLLDDIFDYLSSLNERKRYFIYLSNSLDYLKDSRQLELLSNSIVKNDKIEEGSIILITSLIPYSKNIFRILLRDSQYSSVQFGENSFIFGLFRKYTTDNESKLEPIFFYHSEAQI